MKEGQDAIYYITADGFAAARNSPHLEVFRKHGVEVLLMYDRVDEWVLSKLTEFDGKPLQSVAKGDSTSASWGRRREGRRSEGRAEDHKLLVERMQGGAQGSGQRGPGHQRFTDSPACLVAEEHGISTNLERCSRRRASTARLRPVLEINPEHPIVQRLKTRPTSGGSPTGATSCSIRRRSPRAASSRIRRRSSSG